MIETQLVPTLYIRIPNEFRTLKSIDYKKIGPTTGGVDKITQYRKGVDPKIIFKFKSINSEDESFFNITFPYYDLKLDTGTDIELYKVKLLELNSCYMEHEVETHEFVFECIQ